MFETFQLQNGAFGRLTKALQKLVSFRTPTAEGDQGAQYTLWSRACHGALSLGEHTEEHMVQHLGLGATVPSPSVFLLVLL